MAAAVRFALLSLLAAAGPLAAQDPTPLVVRYNELTNREQYKFAVKDGKGGSKDYTRAVGAMQFEFPLGTFPSEGLGQTYKSYCIEPLTPMYAGQTYAFAVQPFGEPKDFPGLKNTDAGKKTAEKRADYVRELYGKYYKESLDDPVKAPAFQVALWELMGDTEFPDGPAPFSLFTGALQANYPNGAAAPAFVQQAQTYLQDLTGDPTAYTTNPALANTELVRLTGVATVGLRAQSQLAVRNVGGGVGGGGPLGGGLGGLGLGGGLPIANYGGGGGGGFPGGGAIGFPFFPVGGYGGGGGGSGSGGGTTAGGTGTPDATTTGAAGTTGSTTGTPSTGSNGPGTSQGTTGTASTNGNDNGITPGNTTATGMSSTGTIGGINADSADNGPATGGITGVGTATGGTTATGTGTGSGPGGPGAGNTGPGSPVPAPPGVVLGLGAVALMLLRRRAARDNA